MAVKKSVTPKEKAAGKTLAATSAKTSKASPAKAESKSTAAKNAPKSTAPKKVPDSKVKPEIKQSKPKVAPKKAATPKKVATPKPASSAKKSAPKPKATPKETVVAPTTIAPAIETQEVVAPVNDTINIADLAKPKAKKPTTIADPKNKVKNLLISQPFPENGKSPFLDLGLKYKIKVDFRSFIQVEELGAKEFRRLKINIPDYTAIIFNSKNAIDYFFKLCDEMRVKLSQEMKYFCVSETIALYLQKYIQYRKRKVFFETPQKTLFEILLKHHGTEKFLYPCAKDRKDDIPNFLSSKKFTYVEAFIYKTVPSDLSDLTEIKYDMIIFFSPVGIKSLFYNFPDFEQDDRRIGGFGTVTQDAIRDSGLRLDILAPTPQAPSMAQAIENYIKTIHSK